MSADAAKGGAVVIGASGGIGQALVAALRRSGRPTIALSRSASGAEHIDITDEASIATVARHLAEQQLAPNLVIVATGLLHHGEKGPEKRLQDLDADWLARTYAVNAIGPALVAKHFLPLMPRQGRAIFAVISARVGSISDNRLGGWYGYRASKAALNMMIRNIAIEWTRRNDQAIAVALHPGTVDTALSQPFQGNVPARQLFAPDHSATCLLEVLAQLEPGDSGDIFAWDGQPIQP